jgi:hypothetical protein
MIRPGKVGFAPQITSKSWACWGFETLEKTITAFEQQEREEKAEPKKPRR